MSDKTQVMENIKEAFENIHKNPSIYKKKILTYIFNSRPKEEYQDLSDTEVYDIVGKALKSNPEDFMKYIHNELRKKFSKKFGEEKLREMDRYILENFCFYSGEQILYECDGRISLRPATLQYVFKSGLGPIFFTNYRIIAQGDFKAKVYTQAGWFTGLPKIQKTRYAAYKAQKAEDAINDISEQEDLPCYGYMFPTKNLSNLKRKRWEGTGDISYTVELNDGVHIIQIHSPSFKIKMEENINKAYDVLLKSSKNLKEIRPLKREAKEVIPPLEKKIVEPSSLTIEKEQKEPIEKIDEQLIIKESTPSAEQIIPQEKDIAVVKINVCPFCGMEIDEDINFCSQCGMKIKKD